MQNKLLLLAIIVLAVSCGDSTDIAISKEKVTPAATVKDSGLVKFDLLESIFQNDNWLLIDGRDSSYLYCSRLGKNFAKTYHFNMFKGDSVNTVITSIQLSGDVITWRLPMDTTSLLQLTHAATNKLTWTDKAGLNKYIFEKQDSNHIHIQYPGKLTKRLVKTTTLSSFLVRSKYDYLHGTKLAFNTVE